jgi:hypothetical protein
LGLQTPFVSKIVFSSGGKGVYIHTFIYTHSMSSSRGIQKNVASSSRAATSLGLAPSGKQNAAHLPDRPATPPVWQQVQLSLEQKEAGQNRKARSTVQTTDISKVMPEVHDLVLQNGYSSSEQKLAWEVQDYVRMFP